MKMRKEFGPSHYAKMLAGLRQTAEQICREEFNKIVAPAPVQMRLAFMDDKRPELPKERYHAPIDASAGLALTDHDRNLLRNLKIEIPEDARWPLDDDSADPEAAL
jgi:hypothetical protein